MIDRFDGLNVCKKSTWVTGMMNALYPSRCRSCGQLYDPKVPMPAALQKISSEVNRLKRAFDRMLRPWVCPGCRAEFAPVGSTVCTVCGVPFDGAGIDHICGRCLEKRPHFDQARSVALYTGSVMRLVHRLKYQRRMELARPLGRLLLKAWRTLLGVQNYDIVVPVPLHGKKMRQRGFNQAVLLTSKWYLPELRKNSKQPLPPIATGLLKRIKHTPPLTGLNRKERRNVIRGAFAVTQPDQIKGRSILLIDDVLTTGATANECATALKKQKARQVDLLTLARA